MSGAPGRRPNVVTYLALGKRQDNTKETVFSSPGLSVRVRPTEANRYQMMKTYYQMLADKAEANTIGKMKQFASLFTHGVRNGSHLRTAIHRSKTVAEILDSVDRFFEPEPALA